MTQLNNKTFYFDEDVLERKEQILLNNIKPYLNAEEVLSFVLRLNSTISMEHTFKEIARTINCYVKLDHFEYACPQAEYQIVIGKEQQNNFKYNIIDEHQESLGVMRFTRKTPFNHSEIELIESLTCYALFAIRNTLAYHKVLQTSLTDPLTTLGNRRALQKTLTHERELAKRNNQTFSVIAVDIDKFKDINDQHGHDSGDQILVLFSEEIQKYTREYDQVFRSGGEEFIIVLSQTEADTALNVAHRVRKSIDNHTFKIKQSPLHVTISLGVASYTPGDEIDTILKRADQALYQAKHQGRNCVIM